VALHGCASVESWIAIDGLYPWRVVLLRLVWLSSVSSTFQMFLESQSNIYRLEMIISPKQNGFLITVFQECLKKGTKRPNYTFRQHHFGITT
jgi:hypothetical protein